MILYIVLKCRCFVVLFSCRSYFTISDYCHFNTQKHNIVIITIIELSVGHVMLTVNKHNSSMIKYILFRHQMGRKVQ